MSAKILSPSSSSSLPLLAKTSTLQRGFSLRQLIVSRQSIHHVVRAYIMPKFLVGQRRPFSYRTKPYQNITDESQIHIKIAKVLALNAVAQPRVGTGHRGHYLGIVHSETI